MEKLIDAVAAELPRLLEGDDGGFMSRVAHLTSPPKPKPDPKDDKKDAAKDGPSEGGAGPGTGRARREGRCGHCVIHTFV